MPKMMKKAQQMRTMLPMGLRDVMRVSTTSFSPGALLITLEDRPERYGKKRKNKRHGQREAERAEHDRFIEFTNE